MGAPICKDCGLAMIEIGETGRQIQFIDGKNEGIYTQSLWQCPEDKTVALN